MKEKAKTPINLVLRSLPGDACSYFGDELYKEIYEASCGPSSFGE